MIYSSALRLDGYRSITPCFSQEKEERGAEEEGKVTPRLEVRRGERRRTCEERGDGVKETQRRRSFKWKMTQQRDQTQTEEAERSEVKTLRSSCRLTEHIHHHDAFRRFGENPEGIKLHLDQRQLAGWKLKTDRNKDPAPSISRWK